MIITIGGLENGRKSRYDFEKCLSLDMRTFKCLFRDAFIYQMKQTEEGRAYLEDCWILERTQPDRKALRENFGGDIV